MPLLSAHRSQLLENLPSYASKLGITHLGIVPSLIEATLNASQGGSEGSEIGLKYIASGGEKMSDSVCQHAIPHLVKSVCLCWFFIISRFSINGQTILKSVLRTFMVPVKSPSDVVLDI